MGKLSKAKAHITDEMSEKEEYAKEEKDGQAGCNLKNQPWRISMRKDIGDTRS